MNTQFLFVISITNIKFITANLIKLGFFRTEQTDSQLQPYDRTFFSIP